MNRKEEGAVLDSMAFSLKVWDDVCKTGYKQNVKEQLFGVFTRATSEHIKLR